ncbi:hypothetical protein ACIQNG_35355 [Streptomyces sp. NPDC091377]|uniref:hypothetical protein n=1 Tax=Streptomyces sp. NPDC091377 TaxID=3365995 RepID=UPI0037F1D911
MGKRGGRRREEKRGSAPGWNVLGEDVPGELTYVTPKSGATLRIVIEPGTPEEVRDLVLRYWSREADGSWTNRVVDLGEGGWVAQQVTAASHAELIDLECLRCGNAPRAGSRSQVAPLTSARENAGRCPVCLVEDTGGDVPEAEDSQGTLQVALGSAAPAAQKPVPGENDAEELAAAGGEEGPRLELEYIEGAAAELADIARQYWALSHLDSVTGEPVWSGPVRAIDTSGWGAAHIAAGAAAWAWVPDRACPECGGPLSLTSRTAFAQACLGEPQRCVECTPGFAEKLTRRRETPRSEGIDARPAPQARYRRPDPVDILRARWVEQQEEQIRTRYQVAFAPDVPLPESDLRDEATALAFLHYAPSSSPLGPVRCWDTPLDPSPESNSVGRLAQRGFLRIHPDSSPEAFVWAPESFTAAVTAAGGDLDAAADPELTDRYFPREAIHYVRFGSSMGTAAQNLTRHLTARLTLATFDQQRQGELLELVQDLIAAEALRYFDLQLEKRHLPPVPDTHLTRLKEFTLRGSGTLTLGELNNLVWRAARSAADAAQRNPQAPRANMSTFAVNCLETYLQQAATAGDNRTPIKPYTIDPSALAALTRTTFYTVLEADPFVTGVPQIAAMLPHPVLPEPLDAPSAPVPPPREAEAHDTEAAPDEKDTTGLTEAFNGWLRTQRSQWSPDAFTDNLQYLTAQAFAPRPSLEQRQQAHTARQMTTLYQEMFRLLDDPQEAVLATCLAAQHLLTGTQKEAVEGIIEAFADRVLEQMPSDSSDM